MATNRRAISRLNNAYQMCRAGERGFATVAANVKNRGLKVVLRHYAYQRAQLAEELRQEIKRLGGNVSDADNPLGMVHRGRMDFYATFTIGEQNVEDVLLSEAMLGERAARGAYQHALSTPLTPELRAFLERQQKQVYETGEEIHLLRGRAGKRLVVRLFDTDKDLDAALKALEQAGIKPEQVAMLDLKQMPVYEGRGSTMEDVLLSGAVGGAIWGGIIGAVAGISAATAPGMPEIAGSQLGTWAVIAVSGIVLGALGAMVLGIAVTTGIVEEDAFVYENSLTHGAKLVRLTVDSDRAEQAAEIMHQINSAARAHLPEAPAQATAEH